MKKDINNQRKCTHCNNILDIALFYNGASRCKKCDRARRKELYTPEKGHSYYKKISEEQKEKRRLYARNKRNENVELAKEKVRNWRKNNPNYKKNRWKNDLTYKIKEILRGRLYKAIKGYSKEKSAMLLIGCSIDELKLYIEQQFKKNMSWDNYGEWHIDHIKPCSLFDFNNLEEQQKCFHYTNLQPLWALENLTKSNKYE